MAAYTVCQSVSESVSVSFKLLVGETGAGLQTLFFFLIDHITFITQERQPKLISSERVICQLSFHQALKFHTHVVLEKVRGQLQHNDPEYTLGATVSVATLLLDYYSNVNIH